MSSPAKARFNALSRIAERLAQCRAARRPALAGFITAGDPTLDATLPALHALVRGGADLIEVGVPFSDPEAEGPPIQRSSERALANGVTLSDALRVASTFRRTDSDTPLVLMGYLNPVLRMGYDAFAERAGAAGVDGVILVNLPPEEAGAAQAALTARGLDLIFLVAPTTAPRRAAWIAERAAGFIYYVSLKGVTGAHHLDVADVQRGVRALREVSDLPVLVGFGIRDAKSARAVAASGADGVVIGSALVDVMGELGTHPERIPSAMETWLKPVREALDAE